MVYALCDRFATTVDYLPDASHHYPFIFISSVVGLGENNSDVIGEVSIPIEIYGVRTGRNELDKIQFNVQEGLKTIKEAFGYNVRLLQSDPNIRPDNTDKQPLTRITIDIRYQYTIKER